MDFFKQVSSGLGQHVEAAFGGKEDRHSHSHGDDCQHLHGEHADNRYHSFAPESRGNVKWYVDGASYFWAVSEAISQARESLFVLDWWLSPELYLRRPPAKNEQYRLDRMLKAAAERGVKVYIIVYKEVEAALTLNSSHTRTALEALHPNIRVFRHPDHLPTGYDLTKELGKSFAALTNMDLAKASGDALKAVYGTADGMVLYWAHHEKLLVIDNGRLAFMGGLDMCFGRWDTSSHPIADAHPGNLDAIIFPGQDYNNARVYDFADVQDFNNNKLDRTKSSRMGWSDVALSMNGPITTDLVDHFVDRWNFIFKEKYAKKNPGKYHMLEAPPQNFPDQRGRHSEANDDYLGGLSEHFSRGMNKLMSFGDDEEPRHGDRGHRSDGDMPRIQLTRSCAEWSSGHTFFITATDDKQRPVKNKIGAAIVERVVRAFQEGEPFHVWVLMPAVPAFAGDLQADEALGTRAIMEFQYNSISRGGYSIIEKIRQAGIRDPGRYIGFYNLRNFDRINTSQTMADVEARAGVSYEEARRERDQALGGYAQSTYGGRTEHNEDRGGYSDSRQGGGYSDTRQRGGYQDERYGGSSERDEYRGGHSDARYDDRQRGDDHRGGYSDSRHGARREGDDHRGGYQEEHYYGRSEGGEIRHPYADPRFDGGPQRQEARYGDRPQEDQYQGGYSNQSYGSRPEREEYGGGHSDARFDSRPQRHEYQGGYSDPSYQGGHGDSRYDNRPQRQEYQGGYSQEAHSESRYDSRPPRQEQQGGYSNPSSGGRTDRYERYQQEASKVADNTIDTISACYMDQGPSVANLRWEGNPEDEISSFVTEELYIHSKLLIADDRLVICGSANLNDRSQLGSHDSEIAVVIEDPTPVESYMDGRPYTASRFAASLRRYIFRKHLGLIPDQRWDEPNKNWTPVDRDPNQYDWGSPADLLVRDPLHPNFQELWASTARVNTETFSRAFHPVPNDHVRTWKDYDEFFARHFIIPGKKDEDPKAEAKKGKVEYGHVVREEFPGGVQEVKQWLSRIRGTLVEMPLDFLVDVDDIAKEGLSLNSLTSELYT
ncbi:hypothetical protein FZEAL_4008 [Fusarium zealandicum]|uniref:phospholipase D n=1 Tax=Fusarium zealandicum TaxID=1053134 RepID=A0A8H4UNG0_9HYPO|nr:hypothetical protein FZEAL_4008 [Fusarium zealandicum]